jgi:hypothetical protein
VIRARLACAVADASLAASSTPADTDTAFMPLMQAAGAGRYLNGGGLVFARAARAFAMHGATARAIDMWRQAIRLSGESRLYGDVAGCRRALNAAILEQPVPAFAELAPAGPLPNTDRLLAITQSRQGWRLRHRVSAAAGGAACDLCAVTVGVVGVKIETAAQAAGLLLRAARSRSVTVLTAGEVVFDARPTADPGRDRWRISADAHPSALHDPPARTAGAGPARPARRSRAAAAHGLATVAPPGTHRHPDHGRRLRNAN